MSRTTITAHPWRLPPLGAARTCCGRSASSLASAIGCQDERASAAPVVSRDAAVGVADLHRQRAVGAEAEGAEVEEAGARRVGAAAARVELDGVEGGGAVSYTHLRAH